MDPQAPSSSGYSEVSHVLSSNAHYSTAVPTNAHVCHIRTKPRDNGYFDVRAWPKGTFFRSSFKFKNRTTLEVQEMVSNPRKCLTTSLGPAGPERDCEEITLRFEIDSTNTPVDSDYSSNDETVGRSKLE
ncbi:hypothetical protein BKA57DRAFT_437387 [Linnemannia elongata]|nr:hypothetical protein BKA57DRAFT_437387 [Linnemannia elongata]